MKKWGCMLITAMMMCNTVFAQRAEEKPDPGNSSPKAFVGAAKKLPIYKAIASSEQAPQYGAMKAIDGRASTASWLYSWYTRRGRRSVRGLNIISIKDV